MLGTRLVNTMYVGASTSAHGECIVYVYSNVFVNNFFLKGDEFGVGGANCYSALKSEKKIIFKGYSF